MMTTTPSSLDVLILAEAQRVDAACEDGSVSIVKRSADLERQSTAPRIVASLAQADSVAWLLLAKTETALAEADALARSFVWPSYARPTSAVPATVPKALLTAISEHGYLRPIVLLSGLGPECLHALDLMLDVLATRPIEGASVTRHISRVLRDLEDALARRDPVASAELLDEARATGSLSVANESALRISIAAAHGDWAAGIEHATVARLAERRLAINVQHDLLVCIYHVFLAPHLAEADHDQVVESMRDEVLSKFGAVFDSPSAARTLPARISWIARLAAAPGAYSAEVIDAVLDGVGRAERTALAPLLSMVQSSDKPPTEIARALLSDHEAGPALEIAVRARDIADEDRVEIISSAGSALGDIGATAARVEAALKGTNAPDATTAAKTLNSDIDGWLPFLKRMFDDPSWPEAGQVLEARSASWSVAVPEPLDPSEIGDLLEVLVNESPAARDALPKLLLAVNDSINGDEDLPPLTPLFMSAARAIGRQDACGLSDMSMMADALSSALRGGVTEKQYCDLCTGAVDAWMAIGAPPKYARFVVDAVSTLLDEPSRDAAARERAIGELVSSLAMDATRPSPRVPREVWVEITEMLAGHGLQSLVPAAAIQFAGDDERSDLDDYAYLIGKKVLIHSLVPGVPERALQEIVRRAPGATVVVDDSKVGSGALREHVRSSDVILLAHRACKHAVSDFIKAERQPESQLRYATGKGWSSLVDAARLVPRLG